jgi:hypothetical protein
MSPHWLAIIAYSEVGLMCVCAAIAERKRERVAGAGWFWLALAAAMMALALGKQFQLGDWLSDLGRGVARSEGWYRERRAVQEDVIGAVAALGILAALLGAQALLPARRRHALAFACVVCLACFIVIRAVSLHDVDLLLYGRPVAGLRLSAMLESGGQLALGCIALLAVCRR